MYADDTTLYCNISQNIGEEVINAELVKPWEWLGANKLSLNNAKTNYMVFIQARGMSHNFRLGRLMRETDIPVLLRSL